MSLFSQFQDNGPSENQGQSCSYILLVYSVGVTSKLLLLHLLHIETACTHAVNLNIWLNLKIDGSFSSVVLDTRDNYGDYKIQLNNRFCACVNYL